MIERKNHLDKLVKKRNNGLVGVKPYTDEIEAIKQAEADVFNGDVVDLASVNW